MKKRKDDAPPTASAAPASAAVEVSPAAPGTVDLLAFADWVTEQKDRAAETQIVDEEHVFVSFRLGREEFGVPIENVREILRVDEITRVPHAPPHVRGVTNVRGRILPVVEIRTRIGMTALVPTPASRIVVLEVGTRSLGLLVDGDARVAKVRASQVEPPPEEIVSRRSDYVRGVAKRPEGLLILLDPERTLVVKE